MSPYHDDTVASVVPRLDLAVVVSVSNMSPGTIATRNVGAGQKQNGVFQQLDFTSLPWKPLRVSIRQLIRIDRKRFI